MGFNKVQMKYIWLRMGHLFGPHEFVKLRRCEVAEFKSSFAKTQPLVVSLVSNLGRFVVAYFGAQGRNEHERILHILIDAQSIDLHSVNAMLRKRATHVGEQPHRMQEVMNNHRLENIQLKISL